MLQIKKNEQLVACKFVVHEVVRVILRTIVYPFAKIVF
jgi:hypothetical protein